MTAEKKSSEQATQTVIARRIKDGSTVKITVDARDFARVSRHEWRINSQGTVYTHIKDMDLNRMVQFTIGRFILGFELGDNVQVRHADRDRTNATRSNLVVVSYTSRLGESFGKGVKRPRPHTLGRFKRPEEEPPKPRRRVPVPPELTWREPFPSYLFEEGRDNERRVLEDEALALLERVMDALPGASPEMLRDILGALRALSSHLSSSE